MNNTQSLRDDGPFDEDIEYEYQSGNDEEEKNDVELMDSLEFKSDVDDEPIGVLLSNLDDEVYSLYYQFEVDDDDCVIIRHRVKPFKCDIEFDIVFADGSEKCKDWDKVHPVLIFRYYKEREVNRYYSDTVYEQKLDESELTISEQIERIEWALLEFN